MNDKRYTYILYTIVAVIAVTIGIQVYWNYKNYQTNKQQLINDVQISLDNAVDDYYAKLAEETTLGFKFDGKGRSDVFEEGSEISNILSSIDEGNRKFKNLDSIDVSSIEGVTVFRGLKADSMNKADAKKKPPISSDSFKKHIQEMKHSAGDVNFSDIKILTSKVVISIKNDTLDIERVDTLLQKELKRKNISVDYSLNYQKKTDDEFVIIEADSSFNDKKFMLRTVSKSSFLPDESELSIQFTNETLTILKRIIGGIIISTLLVIAVISCLFYLLKIIKHQKQLAEVKNDLISNITHEFKTPIATIGVALESMSNFNAIEDKEKTKKYLSMSTNQLIKLNLMVEKLLETATLDSDHLELNKESVNIVKLLNVLISRYKIQFLEKEFKVDFNVETLDIEVDPFHFENALNNILDNAVKYGGNTINVDLKSRANQLDIQISDNGTTLNKTNKDRIFEKFYRIPKGNTHDVKGFGIGLYYTKTIIDKHNGSIKLDLNSDLTTFKITFPNGK